MNTLRAGNSVVPRCLDWYAGEDDAEDGGDPENENQDANRVDTVSQGAIGEDPGISGDDGEFAEGYRCTVGEIAAVKGFRDSASIIRKIEDVVAQIPNVLSEPVTFSYEAGY